MFTNALITEKIAPPPADPEGIERMRQIEEQSRRNYEEWKKNFDKHKDEWPVCTSNRLA